MVSVQMVLSFIINRNRKQIVRSHWMKCICVIQGLSSCKFSERMLNAQTHVIWSSQTNFLFRDGTTDVTRTWHFGQPTQHQIDCFTRVLKGQIAFADTVFPNKVKV